MENWQKVKELLNEVLDLDTLERGKFLNNPKIDKETRAEIESLLVFEKDSEKLVNLSAIDLSRGFFDEDDSANALIGQTFGAYKVISELGYGGMGAVYLAERADGKFSQRVALKLLKREMNTAALRRRFQHEREILESLEHPNIARLLNAGTTDDKIPYIVMEYVEGIQIDDYCNKNDLELNERLDLFREVCKAVDFAHRNLIVHRDLKPSNILVNKDGKPKLLDFGISKILSDEIKNTDSATITKLGVMTPSYASPEQIQSKSVTTATDIYSLGVILYELLSGHRPFETKEQDLREIYKAIIEDNPPLPSSMVKEITKQFKEITEAKTQIQPNEKAKSFLDNSSSEHKKSDTKVNKTLLTNPHRINLNSNSIRGDLDNIVLKALRKEPERRYSSAENLSEDIKRHLRGLPVTARPNTFSYRTEKFIKRNKASVFAGGLIFIAIFGGIVATLWQARVAQAERTKSERRFNDVRKLANSFLFEFSPMIENLPGSTPARELLVKRALEYLDNLSKESSSDLELQRELAKAYEKVGDVQGNPYNPNIGDVRGALISYEKALSIREKLSKDDLNNLTLQSDLAQNYAILGDLQSNGGDYAKAETLYDKSLELREKLYKNNPNDFQIRAKLAKIIKTRGYIPFFDGDNKKAIEYYERSQDIYEKLHNERPSDDQVAIDYAFMFVLIGEAQGWNSDLENAKINLEKGLDMLIPIVKKYPNDQSFQRTLMLAYNKRAAGYEDTEEFAKSVNNYQKGVEIAENILKHDPLSFTAKRDVALGSRKLAQALDSAGKSKEGLVKMLASLEIFKELNKADPNNSEVAYDIPNSQFAIGETYLGLKDYDSALKILQTSKAGMEAVLKANPTNIYAARTLAYTLDRIGKSYAALAEKRDRQENLQKALEFQSAGLKNLNKLKAEENLAEYDDEEITTIQKEIKKLEENLGK